MDTLGRHLLIEYRGCSERALNDLERLELLFTRAAEAAQVTIVQIVFHRFAPQGVSGVVIVEESHLSIHTWPEHGYAAVDFYTCGEGNPERAHEVLMRGLEASEAEVATVLRGTGQPMRAVTRVEGPSSLASEVNS